MTRPLLAWGISLLATVASTYALDATATAVGLTLAASPLFDGLGPPSLVVVFVASYLIWFYGLGRNLRANATLLERTGTSTNVLSKVCHYAAERRAASLRTRRLAAAAGYVAAEIVKELPYYAGAFGAAALADAVSNTDALVFLIGTNLGAAAYEVSLAGLTNAVLRRRDTRVEPRAARR